MREVKFRAWDGGRHEWRTGIAIDEQGDQYSWQEVKRGHYAYVKLSSNFLTIVYYTGLKDKKGKEIFEGDIVKVNGHVHSIEWNNKAAGFRLNTKGSSHAHTVFLSNIPTLEIIGNIYENPELLAA